MKRFVLAWILPPVLLATLALGPVLLGLETFFLRDVFGAHLELRHALDAGLAEGGMPLVDPYRGGGQALAANPNAVAFHPSALLHRLLPFFPAFNLHLALHLLLAPFSLYWLARELGLERRPAWVAGVTWGFSGFLASQLLFYNLVGGVVAAPALAAAAVRLARRRRDGEPATGAVAATGALWAVLLVSGDPMTAAAAAVAALALALAEVRRRPAAEREDGEPSVDPLVARRRWSTLGLLTGVFAAGLLLALPQVLPFLALLPASARAAGFEPATGLAGSFDPRQAVEWLLPFAFGRPDQLGPGGFWGYRFYQGSWAFHVTLYPGLAALALVAAAGRSWRGSGTPGRVGRRAWILVAAGVFVSLGAFNPLVAALLSLPGLDTLRYPVKLWLWVAMGGALLCGIGWARLEGWGGSAREETGEAADEARSRQAAARRRFAGTLVALAGLLAGIALAARFLPAAVDLLQTAMGPGAPREMAALEAQRWFRVAGASALAALALSLLALPGERSLLVRRPALAGALLVTLHAALQGFFLAPALATEPVALYTEPPLVLRTLPPEEPVVHGSLEGLFGGGEAESGTLPVPEVRWVYRRAFAEAYPIFGPLFGRRYDLNASPEALDTAALRLAMTAVRGAPDDGVRLRLLEAWGLGRLVLHRELRLDGAGDGGHGDAGGPDAGANAVPPALLALPAGPAAGGEEPDAGSPEPDGGPTAGQDAGGAPGSEAAPPARGAAELLATLPSVERRIRVYHLPGAAPEVYLATGLVHLREGAPPLAAAAALADPRFRPGRDAVLALPGRPTLGTAPGEVEVVSSGPGHLEVATAAADPGVLVWQRSRLPQHRATVDGEPVEPVTANLYRVGVPVPAGQHRVRIEVDRTPLALGQAGALAGLLLLLGLAAAVRRRAPAAGPLRQAPPRP